MSPAATSVFAIDPVERLALCVSSGTLSGQDMLEMVERLHDDPHWRPEFDVIWDCRRVEAHIVLPKDVGPIVDEVVQQATGRDVLVEPPTVSGSLIAELLAARSRLRGKDVMVRRSVPDALSALGRTRLPESLAVLEAPPKAA